MTRGGKSVGLLLCAALALAGTATAQKEDFAKSVPSENRVGGWAIGCQAYSFNRYSFFEAVDKTKETGARVMEMYSGQKLSAENPVTFDWNASDEVIAAAKKKLDEAGIKLVAIGSIGGLGGSEAEARKVFEFAKKMGILTICGEPVEGSVEMLDKLANEYGIPVAIHNHPKRPKDANYKYWSPDYILECCKGRSQMIGSCSDTGHWMRSGLDPVECLKKIEGHVISMHLKDLNQMGPGTQEEPTHDVPYGTGKANMLAILDELKRQNFDGVMSIEYEYNWTTSVPEITECISFMKTHPRGAEGEKAVEKKAGKKGGKKRKAAQP